jgi:hypothetical protein
MVVLSLIIIILGYMIYKYPNIFDLKQKYIIGRYIRLDREANTFDPITYANFIIYNNKYEIINPIELSVFPSLAKGNGIYPQADLGDLNDIILVETVSSSDYVPYIEYDLGITKKISNVTIINRKVTYLNKSQKINEKLNKTILSVLNEDRNQVFEKKISNIQSIYSINIE